MSESSSIGHDLDAMSSLIGSLSSHTPANVIESMCRELADTRQTALRVGTQLAKQHSIVNSLLPDVDTVTASIAEVNDFIKCQTQLGLKPDVNWSSTQTHNALTQQQASA